MVGVYRNAYPKSLRIERPPDHHDMNLSRTSSLDPERITGSTRSVFSVIPVLRLLVRMWHLNIQNDIPTHVTTPFPLSTPARRLPCEGIANDGTMMLHRNPLLAIPVVCCVVAFADARRLHKSSSSSHHGMRTHLIDTLHSAFYIVMGLFVVL